MNQMLPTMVVLIGYSPGLSALGGAAIGIIALYTLITRVIPLLSIKNARTSSVAEGKKGIVRIEGIATATSALKSPITGVESIYYKSTILQRFLDLINQPIPYSTRKIFSQEKCAEFMLKDGSGQIKFEGTVPRFVTTEKTTAYESKYGEKPPAGISAGVRKMLIEGRFPAPNDKRFPQGRVAAKRGYFELIEEYIPTGDNVIVVADVSGGKAKPLILTNEKFYRVEAELMQELFGYGIIAFFAFAVLLGFILMLYGGAI